MSQKTNQLLELTVSRLFGNLPEEAQDCLYNMLTFQYHLMAKFGIDDAYIERGLRGENLPPDQYEEFKKEYNSIVDEVRKALADVPGGPTSERSEVSGGVHPGEAVAARPKKPGQNPVKAKRSGAA